MITLFEGIDGVGKSTLAAMFASRINAVSLMTPSPGPLGRVIREIQDSSPLTDRAMAYAYLADQFEVEDVLIKSCHLKRHVILDRHAMVSGPSYRPAEWGILWPQLKITGAFTKPDLGVVLELEPKAIRERLSTKSHPCPWTDEQLASIAKRTRLYTQKFCAKTIVLDGSRPSDELCNTVLLAAVD